jgi:hypothetical protein
VDTGATEEGKQSPHTALSDALHREEQPCQVQASSQQSPSAAALVGSDPAYHLPAFRTLGALVLGDIPSKTKEK